MITIKEYKESTEHQAIRDAAAPKKAFIALSQHFGKPCSPLVALKDRVVIGQKIAAADSGLFSPVHSSVSGTVVAIKDYHHPVLGRSKAIVVENDFKDEYVAGVLVNPKNAAEVSAMPVEELRQRIFEAGIVGLGGAAFPSHVKLTPPKPIDSFILNGAECEPFLTSDDRLMQERATEIIIGMDIAVKILNVKNCFVAIEDNKPEAIHHMKQALSGRAYQLKVLKTQYPQGGEKQLIKAVLNREVPSRKLPFDIGVVVHNVATAFAIYEAIYKNKPLYERVVTVAGSCLSQPSNLKVRIGTPFSELIEACGPLKEDPAKIIMGGPMMGIAQYSLDAPVIKGTSGLVLLSKDEIKREDERFCIRCSRCIQHCPAGLMPALINLASRKERWQDAILYGSADCIECGICSYVCPAKIPLVQSIKYAKAQNAKEGAAR